MPAKFQDFSRWRTGIGPEEAIAMQSANTTRSWDVNRATRERARGWRKQGQRRHCPLTERASSAPKLDFASDREGLSGSVAYIPCFTAIESLV